MRGDRTTSATANLRNFLWIQLLETSIRFGPHVLERRILPSFGKHIARQDAVFILHDAYVDPCPGAVTSHEYLARLSANRDMAAQAYSCNASRPIPIPCHV